MDFSSSERMKFYFRYVVRHFHCAHGQIQLNSLFVFATRFGYGFQFEHRFQADFLVSIDGQIFHSDQLRLERKAFAFESLRASYAARRCGW